jgi:N-acetylmuramoyl-L-alanine amidase
MTTPDHDDPPASDPTPALADDEASAAAPPHPPLGDIDSICRDEIVIVIDPGHGDNYGQGVDSGAIHPIPFPKDGSGSKEKDLALLVSVALKAALDGKPHIKGVYLTRTADVTTKVTRFTWRTNVATAKEAQIFLCIHLNSAPSPKTTGHVAYYYPGPIASESRKLCTSISASYKVIPPSAAGGVISESTRIGIVKFGAPSPVKAATLIEVGFLSNDADRTTISKRTAQLAEEIAGGVVAYVEENLAALFAR